MRRLSFFLVGPGAVGVSLAAALIRAGHQCIGVEGRSPSRTVRARRLLKALVSSSRKKQRERDFDLLILAVPDSRIAAVARAWAGRIPWRGKYAFHTSGALPSSELKPLQRRGALVASVHPLTSLPGIAVGVDAFRGVSFGLEGNPRACRLAARLIGEMKGEVLRIPGSSKPAYHLSACLASGYLLTLLSLASELMDRRTGAGRARARRALLRLAEGSLHNASRLGLEDSLTGPLVRRDLVTLRRHLRVLRHSPPELKRLHDILAMAMVEILTRERGMGRRDAAELLRLYRSPSTRKKVPHRGARTKGRR